jgi:hypothetical protein
VIDVATRKVINHFVLNTKDKQYRLYNGAADPEGKLFYAVTQEITHFPEHYEVAKPKYTLIDLQRQRIVKTVDIPRKKRGPTRVITAWAPWMYLPMVSTCISSAIRSPFSRHPI